MKRIPKTEYTLTKEKISNSLQINKLRGEQYIKSKRQRLEEKAMLEFYRILNDYDKECGKCFVRKLTRQECEERGIIYKEEWGDKSFGD